MPVMLKNRLRPPPTETYSLHRLLSGCFLLNMQLRSKYNAGEMFMRVYDQYKATK